MHVHVRHVLPSDPPGIDDGAKPVRRSLLACQPVRKQQHLPQNPLVSILDVCERCHMLFVGKSDIALLPEIYKRMRGKPTLVITEYAGALDDGSVVNFVKVENLLKYELSMANAAEHGLVVGLTLKNLAHRVEE